MRADGITPLVLAPACALVLAVVPAPGAASCDFDSPPVAWARTADGAFTVRRDNRAGVITVLDPRRTKRHWEVRIDWFGAYDSEFALVKHGTRLVHLRGNFAVRAVIDLAIEILDRDGRRVQIIAGALTGSLRPERPGGCGPPQRWLSHVVRVDDEELELVNAQGERRVVELSTGRVRAAEPAAPPADDSAEPRPGDSAAPSVD